MGRTRKLRRGIYLLPTLFTVGNLFCGYASIVHSSRGALELAALLIIVAGVLDGLDGRIARMTRTTSDFGVQFDSLADIVSFGIAPALLAYHWILSPLGRAGWLVGFIFAVCAAMRLARFNIQQPASEKRHFAGLPSPMAAGAVASAAFALPRVQFEGWGVIMMAIATATVALLMVSRFRYRSFKEFDLGNRRSYIYVLPLAGALVAIAIQPRWALLGISLLYLISAPALYAWGLLIRRKPPAVEAEVVDGPLVR